MRRAAWLVGALLLAACPQKYKWNPDFERAVPIGQTDDLGAELLVYSAIAGTPGRPDFKQGRSTRFTSSSAGWKTLVSLHLAAGLTRSFEVDPERSEYVLLDHQADTQRHLTLPSQNDLGTLGLAAAEENAPTTLVASSGRVFRLDGEQPVELPAPPVHPTAPELVLARRSGELVFNAFDGTTNTLVRFDGAAWSKTELGAWHVVTLDDTGARVVSEQPGQLCTELRAWPSLTPLGPRQCTFTSLFTRLDRTAVWHGSPADVVLLVNQGWLEGSYWESGFPFFDGALHEAVDVPSDAVVPLPGHELFWDSPHGPAQTPGIWRARHGAQAEVLAPVDLPQVTCGCDRARDRSCACVPRRLRHTETIAGLGTRYVSVTIDEVDLVGRLKVKVVDLPKTSRLYLREAALCLDRCEPLGFCSAIPPEGLKGPACIGVRFRALDMPKAWVEVATAGIERALPPGSTEPLTETLEFAPGSPTDGGPKYPNGLITKGLSQDGPYVAHNPFDAVVRVTLSAPNHAPIWFDVQGAWRANELPRFDGPAPKVWVPRGDWVPLPPEELNDFVASPAGHTLLAGGRLLLSPSDGGFGFSWRVLEPLGTPGGSFPVANGTPRNCRTLDRFGRALVRPGGADADAGAWFYDLERGTVQGRRPPAGMQPCFAESAPVLHWRSGTSAEAWWLDANGTLQQRTATVPVGLRPAPWASNDGERLLFVGASGATTRFATWSWRTDTWSEGPPVPGNLTQATSSTWEPTPQLDAVVIVGPPLPGSTATEPQLVTWVPFDGGAAVEYPAATRARLSSNSSWFVIATPAGLRRVDPLTQDSVAVGLGWDFAWSTTFEHAGTPWTNGVMVTNPSRGLAVLDITTGALTRVSFTTASTLAPGVAGDPSSGGQAVLLDDPRVLTPGGGSDFRVALDGGAVVTFGGEAPASVPGLGLGTAATSPWGTFGAPCLLYGVPNSTPMYHLVEHPDAGFTVQGRSFCKAR